MPLYLLYNRSGDELKVLDRVDAKSKVEATELLRRKGRIDRKDFNANYFVKQYKPTDQIDRREFFNERRRKGIRGAADVEKANKTAVTEVRQPIQPLEEPGHTEYSQTEILVPSNEEVQKHGYQRALQRLRKKNRENFKDKERERIQKDRDKDLATFDKIGLRTDNYGNLKPERPRRPILLSDFNTIPNALPQSYQKGNIKDYNKGQLCANCIHWAAGQCHKWKARVRAQYWCKSWLTVKAEIYSDNFESKDGVDISNNKFSTRADSILSSGKPIENLYTGGEDFIYKEGGRPYVGYYSKTHTGEFITGGRLSRRVKILNKPISELPAYKNQILIPRDADIIQDVVKRDVVEKLAKRKQSEIQSGARVAGGSTPMSSGGSSGGYSGGGNNISSY